MADNFQLSEHFSFYELTSTSQEALQAANREAALAYLPTLKALAALLERVRDGRPLVVNSGYRSGALNKATPGSSPTSQHTLGQAADVHRPGGDVTELFDEVRAHFRKDKVLFGQLIDESATRDYGVARWLHVSLGRDFWKPERCGEVLKKVDLPGGKPLFTRVEQIPQEDT